MILGEEGGQVGRAAGGSGGPGARVRWIVDPLDGTVNYLYGLPDWSVSIAAELDGRVTAGVVCVPRRAAVYTAVLGGGAWLRPLVTATAGWATAGGRGGCAATRESRWPRR